MKLQDLIETFSDLDQEAQLEKIRKIRHARTIERPVAAKKRKEREQKGEVKAKASINKLQHKLTPAERAMLIAALRAKGAGQ